MENKELAPAQAFEVVYQATGALQLNRQDSIILNQSLAVLANLVKATEETIQNTND